MEIQAVCRLIFSPAPQDFVNFAEDQENIVDLNEGGYKFGLWENNLPKSTRYRKVHVPLDFLKINT